MSFSLFGPISLPNEIHAFVGAR